MDWNHIFISINVLIAVSCAVMLLLHLLTRQNRQVTDRLDDLSGAKNRNWQQNRIRKARAKKLEKSKDGSVGGFGSGQVLSGVQNRMLHAGSYSPTATSTYAATRLGFSIAGIVIAFLVGVFR